MVINQSYLLTVLCVAAVTKARMLTVDASELLGLVGWAAETSEVTQERANIVSNLISGLIVRTIYAEGVAQDCIQIDGKAQVRLIDSKGELQIAPLLSVVEIFPSASIGQTYQTKASGGKWNVCDSAERMCFLHGFSDFNVAESVRREIQKAYDLGKASGH